MSLSLETRENQQSKIENMWRQCSLLPIDILKKIDFKLIYEAWSMTYSIVIYMNNTIQDNMIMNIQIEDTISDFISKVKEIDKAAKKLIRYDYKLAEKYPEYVL